MIAQLPSVSKRSIWPVLFIRFGLSDLAFGVNADIEPISMSVLISVLEICVILTECCQECIADTLEFAWSVDRILHQPGIDWLTFKLITRVSRKEVHVQVW